MQGLGMPHMGSPDMGGQGAHGLMPFASSQLEGPFAQLVPGGGGQLSHGAYQQAYITASGRPEYLADELLLAHGDESQELPGERQVCTFYLRTGTCAYGDRCKFEHPKDRPPPALNSRGYPIRNEVRGIPAWPCVCTGPGSRCGRCCSGARRPSRHAAEPCPPAAAAVAPPPDTPARWTEPLPRCPQVDCAHYLKKGWW
jgi:hypothetical protein